VGAHRGSPPGAIEVLSGAGQSSRIACVSQSVTPGVGVRGIPLGTRYVRACDGRIGVWQNVSRLRGLLWPGSHQQLIPRMAVPLPHDNHEHKVG
jgi:hypothetical protein